MKKNTYLYECQEAARQARKVAEGILLRGDPAYQGIVDVLEEQAVEILPELQEKKFVMDESLYLDAVKAAYMAGFTAAVCRVDVDNMLIHRHKAGSPWIETHFKYK